MVGKVFLIPVWEEMADWAHMYREVGKTDHVMKEADCFQMKQDLWRDSWNTEAVWYPLEVGLAYSPC